MGNMRPQYGGYREMLPFYAPGENDGDSDGTLHISSPFPNTWPGEVFYCGYNNIGFTKLRNGQFVYWVAEDDEPVSGHQISELPLTSIPYFDFTMPAEYRYECFSTDDYEEESLESMFEGAWVMRGASLVESVTEGDYPEGVLDRLRGGFVKNPDPLYNPQMNPIMARIQKAERSIKRLGGKMFGLVQREDGVIEITIESLAEFLGLSVDVLLAFMASYGTTEAYFGGTIQFLCKNEQYEGEKGIFEITNPVPVGEWMTGYLVATGTGLLFQARCAKFYSVDTQNGVSYISDYNGPGITERMELKLAPLIALSSYKYHE